ncbi:hypothetical protein DOTSEDRAFT_38575 [Dothistroma septosporum NZE10]|uniref:Uncharacterized protein n=1 Tax=Dothistroma septosporum (strain NZE10 / CBS 128990) TaxID=675120 RepID=M2YK80_DOTSN|nr:hypothetical protein DOTSEDRAFT_38575 [Dothistroma septosporum NZE10]
MRLIMLKSTRLDSSTRRYCLGEVTSFGRCIGLHVTRRSFESPITRDCQTSSSRGLFQRGNMMSVYAVCQLAGDHADIESFVSRKTSKVDASTLVTAGEVVRCIYTMVDQCRSTVRQAVARESPETTEPLDRITTAMAAINDDSAPTEQTLPRPRNLSQ